MLEIYIEPERAEWKRLTSRCSRDESRIQGIVEGILEEVRMGGDNALREISKRVEGFVPQQFEVSDEVREAAAGMISPELKTALDMAKANISKFHEAELPKPVAVEVMPGVRCVQKAVAIEKVGLYIPGGQAPLFSTVLMLALPAKIAGCREVVLCTPPSKEGKIAPEILYAAGICGVDHIFALGGAQAIAAMAYGTETVPKVDKIFGPGNRFVMKAKQMVAADTTAIDMPAGPSEVMVLADDGADPEFVASDLLSQAEHGSDSQGIAVCRSYAFAELVKEATLKLASEMPRSNVIHDSLANSRIVVLSDPEAMMDFANSYAPEHLILALRDAREQAGKVSKAGSVFIGDYSPESAGDYASGTNHTLPTSGWACAFGGVNTESFMRKMTFQELTKEGLESLSETIVTMAEAEGLEAHANAVRVRIQALGNKD